MIVSYAELALAIYFALIIRDLLPWAFSFPRTFKLRPWLVWLDILGNVFGMGDYRHTISGRLGWQVFHNFNTPWNFAQRIVDWAFFPSEPDHCKVTYKNEMEINQFQRGGLLGLVIVTVLAVVFSPFIKLVLKWH